MMKDKLPLGLIALKLSTIIVLHTMVVVYLYTCIYACRSVQPNVSTVEPVTLGTGTSHSDSYKDVAYL